MKRVKLTFGDIEPLELALREYAAMGSGLV
jgi:hypothetical protein